MKKIFQIQIALKGVKPKIWRRVLVPSDVLLSDLHEIIQISMGWSNAHLHQFVKNDIYYGVSSGDDWDDFEIEDYSKIKLSSFLKEEKDKFKYEYDFGDNWEHDIILEKILPIDDKTKYPVCLTGKMSCPPEDCGGVWGYSDMLEILKQPDHEEYESYIEWLGGEFDPKSFNKEVVNALFLNYFS
ncbi:plasmid pRiA4b ORF-3 family protein [Geofilum rubicundum]|uniref:Plasmid pRiA4b Orf3-like domain-containing protein n=1 Tax=Geofilum rubicundum JCM 15548 TaxID=1236989 RepID=A0A0E9LRN0_9BACT|nr:plasmid pRiA4b ORF-3 family protein [Geofilum rubicundum]GAO27816.1 hypothetical protein JCM15548_14671 [Geofilum rubicundum JCM 15548]